MTTRPAAAELVESREILPGQWLQSYHAPTLASGSRAGQYIQTGVLELAAGGGTAGEGGAGSVMRRSFALNTADPATGIVTIHFQGGRHGVRWLTRLRPGEVVHLFGPYGRPFEADARNQHLLLVAVGPAIAGVRMLIDEAIRAGRRVTLLFGAATAGLVYPSTLLPDEVEYVVATLDGSLGHHGTVTELVAGYEAWADQMFACGPMPILTTLAQFASGRRERLGVAKLGRKRGAGKPIPAGSPAARRKAFLQVSLEQEIGCATGSCLGCAVMTATGTPQRVCREGPVFAAEEIAWEEA